MSHSIVMYQIKERIQWEKCGSCGIIARYVIQLGINLYFILITLWLVALQKMCHLLGATEGVMIHKCLFFFFFFFPPNRSFSYIAPCLHNKLPITINP